MSNNSNNEYPEHLSDNLENIDHENIIDLLESSASTYEHKTAYYSFNTLSLIHI